MPTDIKRARWSLWRARRTATAAGKTGRVAILTKAIRDLTPLFRAPAPPPYGLTDVRGHTLDNLTDYALLAVENRLGYKPRSLTVLQGSYNGGTGKVTASAGTHDGGGAVDLTAVEWQKKLRALKSVGFAAWHRPQNWDGQGGGEHIHCELIGNAKLSPAAQEQITQYRDGLNGLANHAPDVNPWRPEPIPTFQMPKWAVK